MIVINNPNAGESSGFLKCWLRTGRCWRGLRPQATAPFLFSWTLGGVQPTELSKDTPACDSHGAWGEGLGPPAADCDRCPDTAHEAPGEDPQVLHPSLPEAHRDPPRKPQPPAWLLLFGGVQEAQPQPQVLGSLAPHSANSRVFSFRLCLSCLPPAWPPPHPAPPLTGHPPCLQAPGGHRSLGATR